MTSFDELVSPQVSNNDNSRWATVTQASPLRVKVDGDASALAFTPDTLVAGLQVNDRVWVQIINRRLVIVGKSGGGGGGSTLSALTDVSISSIANRNVLEYDGATSLWKNRKDILLEQATSGAAAISSRVASDTQERLIVGADGKHNWGSGSATQDTNLYRSAADTLKTDDALIVGLGATIGTGATITSGGLTVTAGDVTITAGDLQYAGRSHARGRIGTSYYTGGTSGLITTTETAITFTTDTTFSLSNNRLFKVTVQGGCYENAGSVHLVTMKIRKGANSTSGTQLVYYTHQLAGTNANVPSFGFIGYFKNTSGSTVSSKLSLTLVRVTGTGSVSYYGDSNILLSVVVEDVGSTSDDSVLAGICTSV